MVKAVLDSKSDNMARNRLVELKGERTWKALADELKMNQGYLYRVVHGKRHASSRLRRALGITATKSPRQPDPVWRRKRVRNALWSIYSQS